MDASSPTAAPADSHVHTEWSWDATGGSMVASCARAVELGLPAIAFTEHADFVRVFESQHPLDLGGYLDCLDRCRAAFPGLRIVSGVEVGEPHRFPEAAAGLLAGGGIERVLGSVHCIRIDGEPVDMSHVPLTPETAPGLLREYLAEVLALATSAQPFEILAHLDYPKRYWPHDLLEYRPEDFEDEIRAVLRALVSRDAVLEINTSRGREPRRGLCPGWTELGWWYQEGGAAVSFGSDAHSPDLIAAGFPHACAAAEAAGFRPAHDPADFWRR